MYNINYLNRVPNLRIYLSDGTNSGNVIKRKVKEYPKKGEKVIIKEYDKNGNSKEFIFKIYHVHGFLDDKKKSEGIDVSLCL